jgi:putative addiction module component (TIGR02574 family)
MSRSVEKLKSELVRLSNTDRVELAQFLIRSLDREQDDDADAAWATELTGRITDIERGTAAGKPAEQVFGELRTKYSCSR